MWFDPPFPQLLAKVSVYVNSIRFTSKIFPSLIGNLEKLSKIYKQNDHSRFQWNNVSLSLKHSSVKL